MSFLAPWFLVGALAIAGPVLFHLIRRSARERIPFSSLLFLRPVPPRATRRRKLEHLILLALRCLAVLLLAGGFARPFFANSRVLAAPETEGRQTIILLDTSASMRREGLWRQACATAARYFEKAGPDDRLAVMAFDQQFRTLVSFADWSGWPTGQRAALAKQRLDSVSPGWYGTHLGLALSAAAEQFLEETHHGAAPGQRTVALISDLQEGANLDGVQGRDWPKGVRVILEPVQPKRPGNAGLEILDASRAGTIDPTQQLVRVVNSRDSEGSNFKLRWRLSDQAGVQARATEIYVPPGQTRVVPAPELAAGITAAALELSGDGETFDNTAHFATPQLQRVVIAYFGAESANDPEQMLYYVQRAFPPTALRKVDVVASSGGLAALLETLPRAALAVIPADLPAEQAKAVRDWVAAGKTALLVLSNAQSGATLATLAGVPRIELHESTGEYALLGQVDFSHPVFAPFAEPKYSDFSRIHFWKHRRWSIPPGVQARVLAKFDDDAPALVQISVGKGNLLVLAAGWHPAESQLAISSKFLPLMQTLLEWSGGVAGVHSQFHIGDTIGSPVLSGDALAWRRPDGKVVLLAAGTPFSQTDVPGIYTVTVGTQVRSFAVNLPLDESRTAALSADELARLGIPIGMVEVSPQGNAAAVQRHLQQEELERRQKLWRWAIIGLLALAFIEIGLAGWLGHRPPALAVNP